MSNIIKLLIMLCAIGLSIGASAKPLIVTTIRPLTMLAQGALGNSVEIRQLLPDSELPHHYSMHIAQRALLEQADLLVWIGPELEGFLAKTALALAPGKVITAAALPDIRHLNGATSSDPHIWMSPHNGQVIATELGNWLIAHYPALRDAIQQSQAEFSHRLQRSITHTEERLAKFQNSRILVDHDAFGHFLVAFKLEQSDSLKSPTGLGGSPRHIHHAISNGAVDCLIAEPRHHQHRIERIADKISAPTTVIDPLGADIPLGEGAYGAFIESVGETLARCLEGKPDPTVESAEPHADHHTH